MNTFIGAPEITEGAHWHRSNHGFPPVNPPADLQLTPDGLKGYHNMRGIRAFQEDSHPRLSYLRQRFGKHYSVELDPSSKSGIAYRRRGSKTSSYALRIDLLTGGTVVSYNGLNAFAIASGGVATFRIGGKDSSINRETMVLRINGQLLEVEGAPFVLGSSPFLLGVTSIKMIGEADQVVPDTAAATECDAVTGMRIFSTAFGAAAPDGSDDGEPYGLATSTDGMSFSVANYGSQRVVLILDASER